MNIKNSLNIVILGGGPAGLCAAWNLVKDGHRVTVLEKERVCGGLSITFEKDGYKYDLGPHNIHPRSKRVADFLLKQLGSNLLDWQGGAQIYYRGCRFDYPLGGTQVLNTLSIWKLVACGISFLVRRLGSFYYASFKDDDTYKTWVINRFGDYFYNIFFGPYTRKVWGIPPEELSDIVAKKRIAVKGLTDLIASVFFHRKNFHPEYPEAISRFYPKSGVGEICDFFTRGILEGGGQILCGCSLKRIGLDCQHVTSVQYMQDGKKQTIDFLAQGGPENWRLLSTIPLNEMILMLDGDLTTPVVQAAEGLDFTSEVFLYLNIDKPDVFDCPVFYFNEPEFPFTRIYDVGLFSREMVPPGKNAICLELPCNFKDGTWAMSDDELFELCMDPLEKHGLLDRKHVVSYHTRRVRHAYPRFRVGYQEKVKTILDFVETVPNLFTFGRQGLFDYANIDEVIWMAFEVAKNLPYQDRLPFSYKELLSHDIDY